MHKKIKRMSIINRSNMYLLLSQFIVMILWLYLEFLVMNIETISTTPKWFENPSRKCSLGQKNFIQQDYKEKILLFLFQE